MGSLSHKKYQISSFEEFFTRYRMRANKIFSSRNIPTDQKPGSPPTFLQKLFFCFSGLWFIFTIIWMHYTMYLLICIFAVEPVSIWQNFGYFGIITVSIITMYWIIFNFPRIVFNISNLKLQMRKLQSNSISKPYISFKSFLTKCVVLIILTTAVMLIIYILDMHFYLTKESLENEKLFLYFITLGSIISLSFMLVVLPVMFSLMCGVVICSLGNIIDDLVNALESDQTLDNIDIISTTHGKLAECRRLIFDLDSLYSNIVFFWYFVSAMIACNGVTFLINAKSKTDLLASLYYFQCPIAVLVVNLVAAKIPESANQAVLLLHSLYDKATKQSSGSQELFILASQFVNPPVGLTIGGCYQITKGLATSFLGVSLTYAAILVQIMPNTLSKLQGVYVLKLNRTSG